MNYYTQEELEQIRENLTIFYNIKLDIPNEKLEKWLDENIGTLFERWINADPKKQKENAQIFPMLIKIQKVSCIKYTYELSGTYGIILPIQAFRRFSDIIRNTDEEVLTQKIIEVTKILEITDVKKEDPQTLATIWKCFPPKIRNEKGIEAIEKFWDNENVVTIIWDVLDAETKKSAIVDMIRHEPKLIDIIWNLIRAEMRLNKFSEIVQALKEREKKEQYENFVKKYLGDVEISEDGNIIIPEDLKSIIFNVNDAKTAKKVELQIQYIIKNWNKIKEYIQYRKANGIVENSIEVRKNRIEEILYAVQALNRPIPRSLSAQEFEQTKGSEMVGVDIQYTDNPTMAVQRAHVLSEIMDKSTTTKKYPDFSVKSEDGKIELNVLHPQDKSAILTGYVTGSCFRPNGNADNSGNYEYSLLQYCTTTPYGGVLRIEDSDGQKVYMGTPFLVNGNMMMFHSYETSNGHEANKCNELLVEGAKKAIENSSGSINIVLMTTLYERTGLIAYKRKDYSTKFFQSIYKARIHRL